MKATTFSPMGLVLGLALCACSTPPKPRELDALEKLKGQPIVELARKRAPGLIEDSDRMFAKSREEWDSNDLENSRRDAIMGLIKLKTAIALVEQDQARARETSAQSEYKRSEDDYARAAKELAATNEQITLLQKLQEARSATAAEQQKLTQEQQRAAAQDKVAAAQLALKTAETVDAKTYAAPEYSAAADMLARGETELKNGNMAAAQTSAELAKQKADQAAATAKPLYQQAEQSKQNKARDEALGHDAAGISGVTVRLERRGDVQRLVLPLRDLFVKKQTTLASGREAAIDQVAELLKKYPTYPVQIVGHTDNRGKHDQLVALALARANSVLNALISRGLETKRFLVSGSGPDEPVTDNKTSSGRAQNNRVEIIFLYQ